MSNKNDNAKKEVTFVLGLSLDNFNQEAFVNDLANVLGIKPEKIGVKEVREATKDDTVGAPKLD